MTTVCPYHKRIHLDKSEQFQVNSNCESVDNMVTKSWFVLPPVMELYYKSKHIDYQPLPPFRADCLGNSSYSMDFIYPKENGKVYLTKNFNGEIQPFVLKVAHSDLKAKLFWYLNDKFLGTTQTFHEMQVEAKTGNYYITVTDEGGNEISRRIEIVRE